MKKCLFFIEINDSNIKIVLCNKNLKPYLYKTIDLEEGLVENGHIVKLDRLTYIIKNFINENQIKAKNIILNIQSTSIITREIIFPKLKEKELEKAVYFQIKEVFPVDTSNYRVDYKINGYTKINNQENYNIMIVAVHINLIEKYITLFNNLNLDIINIDTNSNSLARIFIDKNIQDETIALIDIENKITDFVIISKDKILFTKTIQWGLNQIDMLLIEIHKVIKFYTSKNHISISNIYIVGEGTYKKNTIEYIQSKFDIHVISTIDIKETNCKNILCFISLIGLIKKSKYDKFNLMPNYYIDKLKRKRTNCIIALKSVLAIIISSILIISPYIVISFKEDILYNLDLKINDYEFNELIETNAELQETQNTIYKYQSILNSIKSTYSIYNDLELIVDCSSDPKFISSIYIDNINSHIIVYGNIDSLDLLLNFIGNLEAMSIFKNVNFLFESNDINNEISYTVEFDINLKIKAGDKL